MHPVPPGSPGPYGSPGPAGPRPLGAWGSPPGYHGPQPEYPGQHPAYGQHPGYSGPQPTPTQRSRSATAVLLCRVATVVLIALGLSIPFDDTCGWVSYTAWSAFAILAAIAALLPQLSAAFGWTVPTGWSIGAVATGALVGFWVLIALPSITSNAGFCLTVGSGTAVVACWLAPGRRR